MSVFEGKIKQSDDHSLIRPFEWLTNAASLHSLVSEHCCSTTSATTSNSHKKALHVGCGSSLVGEFLVRELKFGFCVDADKDEETLSKMKERWLKRCQDDERLFDRLEFCVVDFSKEEFPYEENSFDLILDKSTLDCTLCSDNATASLLVEVYRCLSVGGCYLLISFHEYDMLFPLLNELPGTHWDIQHRTMSREVEDIHQVNDPSQKEQQFKTSNTTHDKKPLNVFIARKTGDGSDNHLNYEEVCHHVHKCNDDWFQQHQPLLTRTRTQALEKSFENPLCLKDAYEQLFTEAEREHLTFEHFLEDWHAFLQDQDGKDLPTDMILSYDIAVQFLTAMQ